MKCELTVRYDIALTRYENQAVVLGVRVPFFRRPENPSSEAAMNGGDSKSKVSKWKTPS